MVRKFRFLFFLLLLIPLSSRAQITAGGVDPGNLKWSVVKTPHYKIIYPVGLDSLSRIYGLELERYRMAESWSLGLVPGQTYRSRTPVILHAYNPVANGSVTWMPRRMDLYTVPDPDMMEPMPWEQSLAVHESRHLAQMQFGATHLLKPLSWLTGEMFAGSAAGIWPGTHLLEGDAVVAETALTTSGRGRSADFLSYYHPSFDNGDWRNWYRWRYGSYRYYAPNWYALGYMTISGVRAFYDDPLFMLRYFDKVSRRPLRLRNMQKEIKHATSLRLNPSFRQIMESYNSMWNEEADARKPFISYSPIGATPSWFASYSCIVFLDGNLYSIKTSLDHAAKLVKVGLDGKETVLRPFSALGSGLKASGDRLWWSEQIQSHRWDLAGTSRIRYASLSDMKVHDLTAEGRFYNPSPSPDGTKVAASEYPLAGGSALAVFDAADGSLIARYESPDSLQICESGWAQGKIVVSGISSSGAGLYTIEDGRFCPLLAPRPVNIRNLKSHEGRLFFTSDRNGTNELYSIDVESGSILQRTSTKYGVSDFIFDGEGDLYFTTVLCEGRLIQKAGSILDEPVNFSEIHKWAVADKLTAQEKRLAASCNAPWPDEIDSTSFSEPKRYSKILHLPHIHSWAPAYIDYDNVTDLSGDELSDYSQIGATIMSQNHLGTAYGSAGYSWGRDPDGSGYRNSGHFRFTYAGLFPIFDFSLDVGGSGVLQYFRRSVVSGGETEEKIYASRYRNPSVSFDMKAYVPLDFSSGGWSRGFVPTLKFHSGNSMFNKSDVLVYEGDAMSGFVSPTSFGGYSEDKIVSMQYLTASVRGYIMQSTPSSCDYPEYGIGAELGYHERISLADIYSAGLYGYMYGYLPGLMHCQGLRLTATVQHQIGDNFIYGENTVTTRPRGFVDTNLSRYLGLNSRNQLKLTADYSIPIYLGDISCFSPLAYIKNFNLIPHIDYALISTTPSGRMDGNLYSAGAELTAHLANFLWLPYDTRIGFTFSYNGGKSYDKIVSDGYSLERNYVGFVFDMDL